jgi:hypothetical protein
MNCVARSPDSALFAWSVALAAAMIASALLRDFTGAPGAWLWLVGIWTIGFVYWSRR